MFSPDGQVSGIPGTCRHADLAWWSGTGPTPSDTWMWLILAGMLPSVRGVLPLRVGHPWGTHRRAASACLRANGSFMGWKHACPLVVVKSAGMVLGRHPDTGP